MPLLLKDRFPSYIDYLADLIKGAVVKLPPDVVRRISGLPLTGAGGVRQLLGEISIEFFAKAYFPQYFFYETPDFHREAYNELDRVLNRPPAGARFVRVWPRGCAKSTIYNFFAPCNAALYGKRKFLVQFSESETQALGFLSDIKNAVESNEYLLEDFGDVRGDTWRSDLISVKAVDGSVVWIAAAGSGSSVRGFRKAEFRPDFIVLDDMESDESVMTPDRVNKLYTWFQRAVMHLGTHDTDVIVVGTLLAYDCVLDRLMKHPGWDTRKLSAVIKWSSSPLWDEWRKLYTDLSVPRDERQRRADEFYKQHEEELLDGVEVLWPDGKPYKSLMEAYVDGGEASFYAELQNDPINLDECLFKPDWLVYYTQEELDMVRILGYYGALDPSLGKSRLSDYTALIVLGKADNGFIYVVDAVLERLNPDQIINLLISKCREYEFVRFGIETNQYQELLRQMIVERSAREGLYMPIVDLKHTKDKVLRVQALIPYVKNGYIRFNREHRLLIEQMLGFPKLRHDDGPDCLEMAVRMVNQGPSLDPMLIGTVPNNRYDDDDEPRFQRHFFS